MQHACGYEYTARLQCMVVDIRLSTDAMAEFQEQLLRSNVHNSGVCISIGFATPCRVMILHGARAHQVQQPLSDDHIIGGGGGGGSLIALGSHLRLAGPRAPELQTPEL